MINKPRLNALTALPAISPTVDILLSPRHFRSMVIKCRFFTSVLCSGLVVPCLALNIFQSPIRLRKVVIMDIFFQEGSLMRSSSPLFSVGHTAITHAFAERDDHRKFFSLLLRTLVAYFNPFSNIEHGYCFFFILVRFPREG